MAFSDFLHDHEMKKSRRAEEFEVPEIEENYEETPRRPAREVEEDEEVPSEDRKILNEVDFYKSRLYKKIDSCFLRYGLEGLKRIDEGIANSIAKYIDSLKGGTNWEDRVATSSRFTPNRRRPPERVRYRDEELDESEDELPPPPKLAPKPFKKPQKIEGSNPNPAPVRRPGEPKFESNAFNPDLLNAILTDVIPPTEIHEVEVKSNIPRQEQRQKPVEEKVDFAPMPEPEVEDVPLVEEPTIEESVEQPQEQPDQTYDIANDMLAGVQTEDVDLFVPPVIEEDTPETFTSEEELDAPIVESETQTPIDMPAPQPRKRKRKK